jgi:hypothetical protein
MFPEGCTTNNTSLITFRRGAFFGLQSVQPVTISYYSPYFSCAHDVINQLAHIILAGCQPYALCTVKEMPVFEPNAWFFEHHKKGSEEQWETYMRVIREIMGEQLGKGLSEAKLEDKFAYKDELYPSKKGKKD